MFSFLMLGTGFAGGAATVLLVRRLQEVQVEQQSEEALEYPKAYEELPLELIELGPRVYYHVETLDTIKTLALVATAGTWEG
jgi:hypothetical protein